MIVAQAGPQPATPAEPEPPEPAEPGTAQPPELAGPATAQPTEPAPVPADPLAGIEELPERLAPYLTMRREWIGELAASYTKALDARLAQAADAGDLLLAKAWREEKARVEAFMKTLGAETGADPVASARQRATLPDLPEDAPEALKTLRRTWITEREKIRADLDGKLDASLNALQVALTKARRFEQAEVLLSYRESLRAAAPPAAVAATAEPDTPPPPRGVDPLLARATKENPFENTLGMRFVPVPGTDVLFCIHETRYKDYEEYAKKSKEPVDGAWKTQTNDGFEIKRGGEDHPVTRVDWEDAQKFCAWLSEKEGRTYRLPTDREWSFAVGLEERWKKDTTPETVERDQEEFPWGEEWPPPAGSGNYSDASRQAKAPRDDAKYVEGGYDDGFPTTAPVMSFAANKLGLFDLGGNVWEWCEDWYSGEQKDRVLRGGSWYFRGDRGSLLSSCRFHYAPGARINHFGFRCVVVPSGGSPKSD